VRLVELLLAQEGIEPILVLALQSHDRVGGTADDDGSRSPAHARVSDTHRSTSMCTRQSARRRYLGV
jgi:hypothetical protein